MSSEVIKFLQFNYSYYSGIESKFHTPFQRSFSHPLNHTYHSWTRANTWWMYLPRKTWQLLTTVSYRNQHMLIISSGLSPPVIWFWPFVRLHYQSISWYRATNAYRSGSSSVHGPLRTFRCLELFRARYLPCNGIRLCVETAPTAAIVFITYIQLRIRIGGL